MTWRYPWTGHKMDRAITSWRIVSGLINHAAFPRHSPYLLPHAGCPLTLACSVLGSGALERRGIPWLQEPTVPSYRKEKVLSSHTESENSEYSGRCSLKETREVPSFKASTS